MKAKNVRMQESDFGREITFTAEFEREMFFQSIMIDSMKQAAKMIAEKFVEENYIAIVEQLDTQAIANLAIANAGAEISKTLKEEAATKTRIVEKVKTQIFHKGIFGGIKRVG